METNETLSIIRKEYYDRFKRELLSELTETEIASSVHTEGISQAIL
jgi:hypothetical protein